MQKKRNRPGLRKLRKKAPTTAEGGEQKAIAQLKEQNDALERKYRFLLAEYANYKKQSFKQLEDFRKYEGQHLLKELIEKIVDNFDRAMEQKWTAENLVECENGIRMIYKQLKGLLTSVGVQSQSDVGTAFNPALHNALDSAPTKDMPPDHILHVIKKAYLFKDKLLRPAEVIVSRQAPKE